MNKKKGMTTKKSIKRLIDRPLGGNMKFLFDPIQIVFNACENLYGEKMKAINIEFINEPIRGKRKIMGCCNFPDNPSEPTWILINQKLPLMHIPEIISHEIAHFIVGKDEEEHGDEWDTEFEKINKEYDRLAEVRISEIEKEIR